MRPATLTCLLTVLLPLLPACGVADDPAPVACVTGATLSAELYGDVRAALDWRDERLECDGMPRPFGEGARLRFAGPVTAVDEDARIAIIVALPDLVPGEAARELPATVTLMQEDGGRFYSNQAANTCWSDIEAQEALGSGAHEYAIRGIVYCVAPLAELNGAGSITIRDLRFHGRVDWQEPG